MSQSTRVIHTVQYITFSTATQGKSPPFPPSSLAACSLPRAGWHSSLTWLGPKHRIPVNQLGKGESSLIKMMWCTWCEPGLRVVAWAVVVALLLVLMCQSPQFLSYILVRGPAYHLYRP